MGFSGSFFALRDSFYNEKSIFILPIQLFYCTIFHIFFKVLTSDIYNYIIKIIGIPIGEEGDLIMENRVLMYRESSPTAIVYHNKNEIPSIKIPHLHSQYEIYYNISGAEGFFFDNKYYPCMGNDLFVVPKVCVHKALIDRKKVYERCIISIDTEIISAINGMSGIKGSLEWMEYVGRSLTGKVVLDNSEHKLFMELVYKYNQTDDELKRFSVLVEILSFVSHKFKTTPPVIPAEPEDTVEKALLIIEENFRDIKVSEIAKRLYISSSYLSKLFVKKCGITPVNYLLMRKISEAKRYLYMGISVKEAGALSGFPDYSNFIRTFKNIEGYSPGNLEHLSKPL